MAMELGRAIRRRGRHSPYNLPVKPLAVIGTTDVGRNEDRFLLLYPQFRRRYAAAAAAATREAENDSSGRHCVELSQDELDAEN